MNTPDENHLTALDMQELEGRSVELSPTRSISYAQLFQGYIAHVRRVVTTLEQPADSPGAWGGYDLIATFDIRDRVERCLAMIDEPLRERAARWIGLADDELRQRTVPDRVGIVKRYEHREGIDDGWWWSRIPARGPIYQDLRAWAGERPD
jgi:hypothetical protein